MFMAETTRIYVGWNACADTGFIAINLQEQEWIDLELGFIGLWQETRSQILYSFADDVIKEAQKHQGWIRVWQSQERKQQQRQQQ